MQCTLCPLACGADRSQQAGACGVKGLTVAKYYLHPFEEPPVSFRNGSGTVFFGGCSLRCVFCQNYEVSRARRGKSVTPKELADIFLFRYGDTGLLYKFSCCTQFPFQLERCLLQLSSRYFIARLDSAGKHLLFSLHCQMVSTGTAAVPPGCFQQLGQILPEILCTGCPADLAAGTGIDRRYRRRARISNLSVGRSN